MNSDRIVEELIKLNAVASRIAEKAERSEQRLDFLERKVVTLLIAVCGALLAKLFL